MAWQTIDRNEPVVDPKAHLKEKKFLRFTLGMKNTEEFTSWRY